MMGEKFSVLDIYAFMLGRWTRVLEGAPPAAQRRATPPSGLIWVRLCTACWPARVRVWWQKNLKDPVI